MCCPAAPSNSSLQTCTHCTGGFVTFDGALSAPQASDVATVNAHAAWTNRVARTLKSAPPVELDFRRRTRVFWVSSAAKKCSHKCFQSAILVVRHTTRENIPRSALVLSGHKPFHTGAAAPFVDRGTNLKLTNYFKHGLFGAVALILAGARF